MAKKDQRVRYRNVSKVTQTFYPPTGKVKVLVKGTVILPESFGSKHLNKLEVVNYPDRAQPKKKAATKPPKDETPPEGDGKGEEGDGKGEGDDK